MLRGCKVAILQICTFMGKYGDLELFPVKIVVPLIMSLRASLAVQHICVWHSAGQAGERLRKGAPANMQTPPEATFFEPPAQYQHLSIDELEAERRAKQVKHRRSRRESARRTAARKTSGAVSVDSQSQPLDLQNLEDDHSLWAAETAPL
jgi:hypothetical protein